jgi:RNA polymerase sigma factor (sigma-70 family)
VSYSSNTYAGLPDELITALKIEIGTLFKAGMLLPDEIEDFEQELMLHGWRILPRFDPEVQVPLQCFLNQAIHRQAISLLRGRRGWARIPRGMEASYEELCETLGGSCVEDQLVQADASQTVTPHEDLMVSLDLRSVFERLPERQQTLVKLLQSHTVSDAARKMGVSRAVVYTLLTDVRDALRKAGYAPPSRQSNREKLPMQNAASALGISTPNETAPPSAKPDRMKTSYSMWSLFRNCRRAAQLRYLDNIVPIERDPNLAFGSLIHECLERWHRDRNLPAVLEHIDQAYINRHTAEYDHRDWHYARAMMTGYAATYSTEEFEVVALEQVFDAEIINPKSNVASRSFTISGKVDGIVKIGTQYFILEHKTAALVGEDYLERLWTDFQITLYAHYVEQTMGIRISGILYNILLKTRLQQSKGETEEEFEARYADLVAKSKSGKSSAKRRMPETDEEFAARLAEKYAEPGMFHREMLYLSRDRFDQLRAELWELTQAFLHARRSNGFYQNTSFCFQHGRPCPYFQLCRSGGNPNVLENLYTKREPHEELRTDAAEMAPVF